MLSPPRLPKKTPWNLYRGCILLWVQLNLREKESRVGEQELQMQINPGWPGIINPTSQTTSKAHEMFVCNQIAHLGSRKHQNQLVLIVFNLPSFTPQDAIFLSLLRFIHMCWCSMASGPLVLRIISVERNLTIAYLCRCCHVLLICDMRDLVQSLDPLSAVAVRAHGQGKNTRSS